MASQPANTTIHVFQRIRSYRQMLRHTNIKTLCNRMRPLVMAIPGRETQVLTSFDADAGIVTTALTSNRRGLPVVRYIRAVVPFATAAENIAGLSFPVVIGQDKMLEKAEASIHDDLFHNAQDLSTDGANYR